VQRQDVDDAYWDGAPHLDVSSARDPLHRPTLAPKLRFSMVPAH
jgi:hypothetical protein